MLQLPRGVEQSVRMRAWSAISFWTFQVVRKLNEDIAQEKTQANDSTITAVVMLMMIDVSCASSLTFFPLQAPLIRTMTMTTPNADINTVNTAAIKAFCRLAISLLWPDADDEDPWWCRESMARMSTYAQRRHVHGSVSSPIPRSSNGTLVQGCNIARFRDTRIKSSPHLVNS